MVVGTCGGLTSSIRAHLSRIGAWCGNFVCGGLTSSIRAHLSRIGAWCGNFVGTCGGLTSSIRAHLSRMGAWCGNFVKCYFQNFTSTLRFPGCIPCELSTLGLNLKY
jgi:hypothetical protein